MKKYLYITFVSLLLASSFFVPGWAQVTQPTTVEGSWTPVLGGLTSTTGQTYSIQIGKYTKVGRIVTCYGNVTLTAKGTITGSLQIQGLPFTSDSTAGVYGLLSIGSFGTLNSTIYSATGFVAPNSTVADIRVQAAAATDSGQPDTSFVTNTTALVFTILYRSAT